MDNKNNILKKFKPQKILGKGSEGVVIMRVFRKLNTLSKIMHKLPISATHNSKYTIKIYNKPYLTAIIFLKIINYLQHYKNLQRHPVGLVPDAEPLDLLQADGACERFPKTIYKSYLFTSSLNSFNRYISNNSLPNHFSYKNMDNFVDLSSKYKMDKKLYEIMKTYKMTLRSFLQNPEINNKTNILKSFFQQGLLTLLWLYMKKGIVHNDLSYDNFFIQETHKSFVTIGKNKVQLYGYYIVLADFGYAKSMEIVDYKNYPEKIATIIRNELNPISNINEFINLFNDVYLKYGVNKNFEEFENIKLNVLYKELIKLYIQNDDSFQIKLNEFKNDFYNCIEKTYF